MNKTINTILATWWYSGKIPTAPGTCGSVAALPFAYMIHSLYGANMLLYAAIAVFFVGIWVSDLYLRLNTLTGDPKEVVIDEVAGQWLLLAFVPMTLQGYFIGFVLFRAFDIIKPWPISWCDQRFHGGFGIMFDDLLAAIFGVLVYIAFNPLPQ